MELPKGVYVSGKKFIAKIRYKCKLIHLGTYNTIAEASNAYIAKQEELGIKGNNTLPRIREGTI
jgi:hypothetical protein